MKFIRRKNIGDYLEDQEIDTSGSTADVLNVLRGSELEAYEVEIEGKRVVLVGFEPKD